MYENIFEIVGKNSGPTSIILTGVHGNERSGINAFAKIIPILTVNSGKVIFVYGNPAAIKTNKRFIDSNLNRLFRPVQELTSKEKTSYEFNRAGILKSLLDRADILLDLHNSFTPQSVPFAICEPNSDGITKFLPVKKVVYGFDEVEPGGTDYYMNSVGKIGICVECGFLDDKQYSSFAENTIMSFLKAAGNIPNNIVGIEQDKFQMYELYKTKTDNFKLSKQFGDFEIISKGMLIGVDGGEQIIAQKDSIILFARNRDKIGEEAFLLGVAI